MVRVQVWLILQSDVFRRISAEGPPLNFVPKLSYTAGVGLAGFAADIIGAKYIIGIAVGGSGNLIFHFFFSGIS